MRLPFLLTDLRALMRPLRRLRTLRSTLGTVGLALALVAGQGGALLHELSHYSAPAPLSSSLPLSDPSGATTTASTAPVGAQQQQQPSSDHGSKVCDLCLAFAQLAGALHTDIFVSPLVADLRDIAAAFDAPAVVAAETPAPRSRGPPSFL